LILNIIIHQYYQYFGNGHQRNQVYYLPNLDMYTIFYVCFDHFLPDKMITLNSIWSTKRIYL